VRLVIIHPDVRDHAPDLMALVPSVECLIKDVLQSTRALGYDVTAQALPCKSWALAGVVKELEVSRPDLILNLWGSALTGDWSHELLLPAALDLARLRYTGSGPLAIALAQRKDLTLKVLSASSVPTPDATLIERGCHVAAPPEFPVIVKPHREDASIGISHESVVFDQASLVRRVAWVHDEHGQPALVERFIEGREIVVGLLGNPPVCLPLWEAHFPNTPSGQPSIRTFASKWDLKHASDVVMGPATDLAGDARARCERVARNAFRSIALQDYARIDMRLSHDGTPYVIDVNPNCALSSGSTIQSAAAAAGISHTQLIGRICEAALARSD
jgi:D-alanine-D-alanine ligase